MSLFAHQTAMVHSVLNAHSDGQSRVVAVMPTGSGKTIAAGALTRTLIHPANPRRRALVLVHREELAHQFLGMFARHDPFPQGGYHPSHLGYIQGPNNDLDRSITVALIQSLQQEQRLQGYLAHGAVDLLITDECQHAPSKSYEKITQAVLPPGALHLGLTATPFRSDNVSLARSFPDGIVYAVSILDLMVGVNPETGRTFLCDLRSIVIETDVRVRGLSLKQGDFAEQDLAQRCAESIDRYTKAVAAWKEYAWKRPTLVFATDRRDAYRFVETFQEEGVRAALILGTTPSEEREALLGNPALGKKSALETGEIQVLVSVGVLLEGVDLPFVSCGIDGRIPQFAGTFQQMVGRVIRSYRDKEDALWISLAPCDHDLMTVERFIGSESPLKERGVKQFLEEQQKDDTKINEVARLLGDPSVTYEIGSHARAPFTHEAPGVGVWRREPNETGFSFHSPAGIYLLEPWANQYTATWTSPGGKHERLIETAVSRDLAMSYVFHHAKRRVEGKAEREHALAIDGPLTHYTRTVAARRRIPITNKDGSEKTERQVQAIIAQRDRYKAAPKSKPAKVLNAQT